MGRFTESPYEEMMEQVPPGRLSGEEETDPGHKCGGCPYGKGRPCIGFCTRGILAAGRKNRREHETGA